MAQMGYGGSLPGTVGNGPLGTWEEMKAVIVLSLAFAPGVFWLWYFFRLDRLEPEPLHLVRTSFLLGMAAVVPAALVEIPFSRISQLATVVFVAPLVEELCKYLVVRLSVYRNTEFDEPMDGVIYAVAAALGFASLENVFYLLSEYGKGTGPFAMVTATRALLSVPGHALWSGMWGFALGCAKFSDPQFARSLVIRGLVIAIGLHALFNLLCLSGPIWPLGMVVLVPLMWRMLHRRIEAALRASPHTSLTASGGHATGATERITRNQ